MKIRFWGTRGSLPAPLSAAAVRRKVVRALLAANGRRFETEAEASRFIDETLDFATSHTFGGNSPCVQLDTGGEGYVLCDLGSGVREFGMHVLEAHGPATPRVFHVFMSHVHWDHIMGFPYFAPAYLPGHRIRIYGAHEDLERAFRRQHAAPSFPVDFSQLAARIEFVRLEPERPVEVAGLLVRCRLQRHSGDSYAYRFERQGKSVVYATDSEHKLDETAETLSVVDFFRDADLVIFDAMYSLADAVSVKEDWGHSSNVVGVELCQMAGVRHLCLFHHEPANDDERLLGIWRETQRLEEITRRERPLRITAAWDGLEIDV